MNEVIFAVRSNFLEVPGGDTTQITKTKEYLEKIYNLKIYICTTPQELANHPKAKIVHIFDMTETSLKYFKEAKKLLKKIALSPIYWDRTHAVYLNTLVSKLNIFPNSDKYYNYKNWGLSLAKLLKTLTCQKKYYLSNYHKNTRQQLLLESDVLLPNSPEEINIASQHFNIASYTLKHKTFVVPNAFDSQQNNSSQPPTIELDSYILQVARIEPIKNQLGLVNALMDTPEIPILFIGAFENKRYKNYYKKLKALAKKRGNVHFIERVPHEHMPHYMNKAKAHVLASFGESTGLVSLEALTSGTEIIVSSKEYCPVEFYEFSTYGHLCNPYSPQSIKQAVKQALEIKKNNITQDYLEKFSYKATAEATYRAYLSLKVLL